MFNDCCASFERAGLAVGAEKTHWSSTVVSNGVSMRAGEHDVLWERTLTFVGCELEPSGHSGAALAHRIVKANGVFSAWRPILLNPNILLHARAAAFGISVVSSLLWQAGNWTWTESELSRLGSWGARKLFALSCKKRNPNHSIGEHWKQLHRVGHEMAARLSLDLREKALEVKHRFAGHLARLQPGSLPFAVLSLRDRRRQQKDFAKLKDKWHGLHPQRFNCWRWETVFEKFFKQVARPADSDPRNFGWKQVAQDRAAWLASRPAFVACALRIVYSALPSSLSSAIFLSGAGRFAANLPGDRLQSYLDFVPRDFLSFSGFMKPTGCSAGVLMVTTVFGKADSPKVISALPHWFFVLSSQSTIGSALPSSASCRLPCNVLSVFECCTSLLFSRVCPTLSFSVSPLLRAFPL